MDSSYILMLVILPLAIVAIVGTFIFWMVMLFDAIKRQFPNPNMKIIWILVILLTGFVGATFYYFVVKRTPTTAGVTVATIIHLFVIVALLASPIGIYLAATRFQAWSLQQGFEEAVPVFLGAEVLSAGTAGNDLNPIPRNYVVRYKIDPSTPIASVSDFYVNHFTQQGWVEVNASRFDSFGYSKGEKRISVTLECSDSPHSSRRAPASGLCAEYPGHHLLAAISYSM